MSSQKNENFKVNLNKGDIGDLAREISKSFKFLINGRDIDIQKAFELDVFSSIVKGNQLSEIQKTIQYLLNYTVKLKKTEFLAYKMSALQFLFKSPKFTNMIDALMTIQTRDDYIEKKIALICKLNDSIKLGTSKYRSFKKSIEETFFTLPNIYLNNENEENLISERYLYKYLVDISSNMKYLWEQLIGNLELERELKDQITNESEMSEKYKEIYGIHIYLNTLGINSLIDQKNKFNGNNEDLKQSLAKYSHLINEIDGIINKIESIIVNKLESKASNATNEITLYYAYSLLDVANLKKYLILVEKHLSNYIGKNNLNLN